MEKRSEVRNVLGLVLRIGLNATRFDADELAVSFEVSRATLYRYLEIARSWGVDVVLVLGSRRGGRGYEVRNWRQVRRRVEIWYELEVSRSVVDPQATLC